MKFSSSFTVVMKTSFKPSAAFSCWHIKYKIYLQSAPKHVIFILKIQKFSGEGAQPSPQTSPQRERDTPSRTHPPRRLRRLDLRAFGAHSHTPHSEVWLRAWTPRLHVSCRNGWPTFELNLKCFATDDASISFEVFCVNFRWHFSPMSTDI